MRKLHVKTYDIERGKTCIEARLDGLLVAEWTPLHGLSCSAPEARVDGLELAQACAEEWVKPSNPMRGQVADFGETRLK